MSLATRETKFGISLPNQILPDPSVDSLVDVALTADRLNFDSVWVGDRIFHKVLPVLDPLVLLSYVASRTTRVRLGTAVLILPLRNPVSLAKTLSTIDFLSNGRLVLGLSLGGREDDYKAVGASWEEKTNLFVRDIRLMKKLWTESNVTLSSGEWKMESVTMLPKPRQLPQMLFGGYAEGALKRAGRLADGWMAGTQMSPEKFFENWNKVMAYAKSYGRDPTTLEPAKLWFIHVSEDREAAKRLLTSRLETFYGKYDVDANCIFGTPEVCASRLREYYKAGVRTFILTPVEADVEQVKRIHEEIVPNLP